MAMWSVAAFPLSLYRKALQSDNFLDQQYRVLNVFLHYYMRANMVQQLKQGKSHPTAERQQRYCPNSALLLLLLYHAIALVAALAHDVCSPASTSEVV